MEMTFLQSALFVIAILVIFMAALVSLHPVGNWIARRIDEWPNRPMDNMEKRALWASRHYLTRPALPNGWNWPWLKVHSDGTGDRHE